MNKNLPGNLTGNNSTNNVAQDLFLPTVLDALTRNDPVVQFGTGQARNCVMRCDEGVICFEFSDFVSLLQCKQIGISKTFKFDYNTAAMGPCRLQETAIISDALGMISARHGPVTIRGTQHWLGWSVSLYVHVLLIYFQTANELRSILLNDSFVRHKQLLYAAKSR